MLFGTEFISMVSFVGAISLGFQRYFDFGGRSSRSEYWWWWLFFLLCCLIPPFIFWIFLIIPLFSVGARRLHDINRTAWWILIAFLFFWLSFIPIFLLLYWATRPGDDAENRHGPVFQSMES